jgi:hypothetical protein
MGVEQLPLTLLHGDTLVFGRMIHAEQVQQAVDQQERELVVECPRVI